MVLCNTGCYDRDIIDSKPGVSLPTVTGLAYSMSDRTATVTWGIPSNIPSEIARPMRINVEVLQYRPGTYSPVRVHLVTLEDEATSTTYEVPSDGYEYHVIIKLVGNVKDPPYGTSNLIYSLGQTVIVK